MFQIIKQTNLRPIWKTNLLIFSACVQTNIFRTETVNHNVNSDSLSTGLSFLCSQTTEWPWIKNLIKWVNKETVFRMSPAVWDSSLWERDNVSPSSMWPSLCKMAWQKKIKNSDPFKSCCGQKADLCFGFMKSHRLHQKKRKLRNIKLYLAQISTQAAFDICSLIG